MIGTGFSDFIRDLTDEFLKYGQNSVFRTYSKTAGLLPIHFHLFRFHGIGDSARRQFMGRGF